MRYAKSFIPTESRAQAVEFNEDIMRVYLTGGRILTAPRMWFPIFRQATPKQRTHYEIGADGHGLHWPALDEDLSVAGFAAGGN